VFKQPPVVGIPLEKQYRIVAEALCDGRRQFCKVARTVPERIAQQPKLTATTVALQPVDKLGYRLRPKALQQLQVVHHIRRRRIRHEGRVRFEVQVDVRYLSGSQQVVDQEQVGDQFQTRVIGNKVDLTAGLYAHSPA